MVRLEKITIEVEHNLDDFYRDRDRFKGMKLLIDFDASHYDHSIPSFNPGKPVHKKKLKASKFIRSNSNKRGLF